MRLILSLLAAFAIAMPASAATFRVTRTDDPAPNGCTALDCSLREAVLVANATVAADNISLAAQTYTLSRMNSDPNSSDDTRGPLWVKSDVSIYGRGVDLTRVRWNTSLRHAHNVFRIDAGSSVRQSSLSAMTVSHGLGSSGGCILYEYSSAMHALTDMKVEHCNADSGGAVAALGGTLSMTRVSLSDNEAGLGGALASYLNNTLVTDAVLIQNNVARHIGGGVHFGMPLDDDLPSAWTDAGNSVVRDNRSDSWGGGVSARDGVMLDIDGGGIPAAAMLVIESNTAELTGGGVWMDGDPGTGSVAIVTLSRMSIRNNITQSGGGVFAAGPLQMSDVEIAGNEATTATGGGIYLASPAWAVLRRVTLTGNTSAFEGGGLYADRNSIELENVSFQRNQAPDGAALSTAGPGTLNHVTVNEHGNVGDAVVRRLWDFLPPLAIANSLLVDGCASAGTRLISLGGNQYGPSAAACPMAMHGNDRRQTSASVFNLRVASFEGPFDVSGWSPSFGNPPQRNFVRSCVLRDDVRAQPRSDGACDSGAFEQQ